MKPSLAVAFDEFGFETLIQGFLRTVRHHPDPAALEEYADEGLLGDPSPLYPDPGPAEILDSEAFGPAPKTHTIERLIIRIPGDAIHPATTSVVWAYRTRVTQTPRHTAIVLHGGLVGTEPRGLDLKPYLEWCEAAAVAGLDAIFVELPFHLSRTPEGRFSGELFVSGDLIRTLDTARQAVREIRSLVGWLEGGGGPPAGIVGFSLGGFVATQALSVEDRLRFALLMAPIPEPAETFDTTLIGKAIFPDFAQPGLTEADLRDLFRAVRPGAFRPKVPLEDILILAARYDQTVELAHMETFAAAWGVEMKVHDVGHLAMPLDRRVHEQSILPFLRRYV